MKRNYTNLREFNMRKHYILTRPAPIDDVREDLVYQPDLNDTWIEKARRLQVRRWRKLKHQMV